MATRQPIIVVLGHVDHGKTSLLDWIRGTTLVSREAGQITQHIGATEIPLNTIQKVCGNILDLFKLEFDLPGLLFVDTPGHEAFANLRKRGGSIADLAVLVVDINQGVQPQTKEAIEILRDMKVPFVVAATKLDVIPGWKSHESLFINNVNKQIESAKKVFEDRLYNLLGQVSEFGFQLELYNKVDDFSKSVAVVPVSSKTGEGIPELLAILSGLSQKFLKDKLEISEEEPAHGTILEIKEEKGMGTTADVIVYSGTLDKDDFLALGGVNDIVTTKIRSLLKPEELTEIRDTKSKFRHVDSVTAASGVKILALGLSKALAGAPIISARSKKGLESAKKEIIEDVGSVLIETEEDGVILKADTLGSLEAAIGLLRKNDISIKRAAIGNVNKRDIAEASSTSDPTKSFVLAFHVKASDAIVKEAKEAKVDIIADPVIYKILERYEDTVEDKKKRVELENIEGLVFPARIRILPQYIFRQSGPAICGIEVLAGRLKPGVALMNLEGKKVGTVKTIEESGKKLDELSKRHQASASIAGLTIGRQAKGGDELMVDLNEGQFRTLKEKKKFLEAEDIEILKKLAVIKRKGNETWGI